MTFIAIIETEGVMAATAEWSERNQNINSILLDYQTWKQACLSDGLNTFREGHTTFTSLLNHWIFCEPQQNNFWNTDRLPTCLFAPRHHSVSVLAGRCLPSLRCWCHTWGNLWHRCSGHWGHSASPTYSWTGDLRRTRVKFKVTAASCFHHN